MATTNCNVVNKGSGNTTGIIAEFLYDPDHRLASQINISTAKLTRANIYAGGEFLAEDAPDAAETGTPVATQMRVTDQVGLLRGRWDYAGKQNGGCTSFPYGDGFSCTNPSTAVFTGKDRDNESALDYFGARYYSNRMGRFTNPDWSSSEMPVPYASFADPQSLNLYGYVKNSPLSQVDKDGHDPSDVLKLAGAAELVAPEATPIIIGVTAVALVGVAIHDNWDSISSHFSQQQSTQPYDTGTANGLKGGSQVGDGLDVHHVPQSQPASQTIQGYDKGTAPAIALPENEHRAIPTEKGDATRSPRDQLAKDVKDLRNETNASNSQIKKVIEQNKTQYPEINKIPPQTRPNPPTE